MFEKKYTCSKCQHGIYSLTLWIPFAVYKRQSTVVWINSHFRNSVAWIIKPNLYTIMLVLQKVFHVVLSIWLIFVIRIEDPFEIEPKFCYTLLIAGNIVFSLTNSEFIKSIFKKTRPSILVLGKVCNFIFEQTRNVSEN